MSKHEATIARIKAAFPGFSEEPLDPSNPRFASPGPVERECPTCGGPTSRSEGWSTGHCDDCFLERVECES
jgi:hypothetical protein